MADRRANARLADATDAADAVLTSARGEASQILQAARAEGIEAAERVRATQHALARRQAREMVLVAKRQAFETLRAVALDGLAAYVDTEEGRRLSDMVTAAVCERARTSLAMHPADLGAFGALAQSVDRRASLGSSSLIDAVIDRMPEAIETLWR
jgi:vacuolar-type H+-ATPase subunit E/Vma4